MRNIESYYSIQKSSDIPTCRMAVRELASSCGFNNLAIEELALVCSEICGNVLKHASSGTLRLFTEKDARIIGLEVKDEGPGIADISLALKKGYSSIGGSLGLGLDIAHRLMDEMTVQSVVDKGTVVTMKKFLPLDSQMVDYGVISIADNGNLYNGDQYLIREFDGDSVLLAVIDGLGEGLKAYHFASIIKERIAVDFRLSPVEILERCHEVMTNGKIAGSAAVGIVKCCPGLLTYAGIGDIHAYWMDQDLHFFENQPGSVGTFQFKAPPLQEVALTQPAIVCICSDGLQQLRSKPRLTQIKSAQHLAKTLYNHFAKPYGDATALVAEYKIFAS